MRHLAELPRGLRIGALALASILLLAEAAQAQDPVAVRLTVQPRTLVTTLIEVADEQGFFKEVGISPELVTVANGPAAVTALASGSVDVATNAPEVFNALADKGQSVKLIMGQARQLGVLVARPDFDFPSEFPASIASLKGKKIGVTALSSATQYLTIMMLKQAGIEASEVEFVAVGATPSQALANGVVDAGFVTGPQVVISQSLGSRMMVDLRTTDNCPSQLTICGIGQVGMWAMGDWIDKNAETVEKVRRAIAKADMFMHDPANADKVREILLTHVPADSPDALKKGYADYAMSVISGAFGKEDLQHWIEVDTQAGVVKGALDVSKVYAEGTPATADDVKRLAAQ
ncbi:MAG: ABC transporter substrate-binding protein [Rhizobiales bacterium]|nr:ABC transporter substrate-binding protein [Hyphomicrobiales bacterium]OJU30288.1 MAG: hypothetical protein BGN94_04435 [Rhizobiales bacterium 68-8]